MTQPINHTVNTVGVIGAGQMGGGIAQIFSTFGYQVHLYDLSGEQLEKAQAIITKSADKLHSKERITEAQHADIKSKIEYTKDLSLIHI